MFESLVGLLPGAITGIITGGLGMGILTMIRQRGREPIEQEQIIAETGNATVDAMAVALAALRQDMERKHAQDERDRQYNETRFMQQEARVAELTARLETLARETAVFVDELLSWFLSGRSSVRPMLPQHIAPLVNQDLWHQVGLSEDITSPTRRYD